jgi:sialic acid synthase SpsE
MIKNIKKSTVTIIKIQMEYSKRTMTGIQRVDAC